MTMPNFLVIGAAKAGTSALYHYLRQHPEIYMTARKETHFFGYEGIDSHTNGPGDSVVNAISNLEDYQALFDGVTHEVAIGEASPTYLYLPRASGRIKYYLPDVKLIALLRHPADRAYSAYMHLVRDGREPIKDFAKAIAEEEKRIRDNWGPLWHYTKGGFYYEQLARYYDLFDCSQIRVYLYDEFNRQPETLLTDVYHFLGVQDDGWLPDLAVRPNVSGVPRSRRFQRLLYRVLVEPNPLKSISQKIIPFRVRWRTTTAVRQWNLIRPALSPDLRRELTALYLDDIVKLQELIKRDLSQWFT